MSDTVTAADANRHFSRILRKVREGASVTVTSHGQPVARIEPIEQPSSVDREKARTMLLDRLMSQPIAPIEPWTRDELYDL